jgi:hypothetical protein
MFTPPRIAGLLTVLAVGLRLVDLTAWPLPFHPTVQYDCALAARAIWLAADPSQRTGERAAWFDAVGFGHVITPPVLPGLVAGCYLIAGEEIPWVSKLFAAGFWVAAGWFTYLAVVRQTGSRWAALGAFAWFTFAPFGLLVSRSFQAEPVLACGFAVAVWYLSWPGRGLSWRDTLTAGCTCGLCAFAKPGVLFIPLLAGFAVRVAPLAHARGSDGRTRIAAHLAAFAMLMAGPSVLYAKLVLGQRGGELMPELLADRWFYVGVGKMVATAVGCPALAAGLVGAWLAARAGNRLPAALLVGYLGYVGLFTYHCATHDYYHTPLMVLVAVGLGWVSTLMRPRHVCAWALLAILALVCVEPWRYPRVVRTTDTGDRRTAYERARQVVGPGAKVVAVTEDYGLPLEAQTWLRVCFWPRRVDTPVMIRAGVLPMDFTADGYLAGLVADGCEFAVVTDFAEYDAQPELRAALARRGRLVASAPGLLVYDLRPGS